MSAPDRPLCLDLFCGLGGWAEGFLSEGYDVIGFDVERHDYGTGGYPGQLVLQDALTLDGRQFKDAAVIVASPPCQAYSYMAMPWTRAKALAAWYRDPEAATERIAELTALFDACFRIAREANVPLVVENVKGAQPWVGTAKAHYGSFYLWGDVASVGNAVIGHRPKFGETLRARGRAMKANPDGTGHGQGSWFKIADSRNRGSKNTGGSWFAIGSPGQENTGQNPDGRKVPMNFHERRIDPHAIAGSDGGPLPPGGFDCIPGNIHDDGRACAPRGILPGVDSFGWSKKTALRDCNSKSPRRKAASAQIAKIPFPLAQHIARIYKPRERATA